MSGSSPSQLVDHFFRHEYAQMTATLTRRFGVANWDLVEDVVQTALQRALSTWSRHGIPENPAGWLHRVATNLAVDNLRRDVRWHDLAADQAAERQDVSVSWDTMQLQDDQLRMMFVCCDPMVPAESQIALALKSLCGFGNREIAHALLTTVTSVEKRITRGRQRLRESGVEPGELTEQQLKDRLAGVHSVVYLLFNEGYSSSIPEKLVREELCEEAVRLALLLAEHPETAGGAASAFLALLLFHAARLEARIDASGAMLLLKEQDRSQWDQRLIREAFQWLYRASRDDSVSRYHAEALIAAEHCRARNVDDTRWDRIIQAYDLLCRLQPSPIHELNRAIAVGYCDGPHAAQEAFAAIDSSRLEQNYYLWHAARADLARQTGDLKSAREALETAKELAPTNAEKELILRKLEALRGPETGPSGTHSDRS